MATKAQVLKSVGPKLIPFFKTAAIFFVLLDSHQHTPTVFHCIIKCLPIVSLMIFVLLQGIDFSDAHAYSRKILLGLIFSCVGDAFLVWQDHGFFEWGLASFVLAHIAYVSAFGMQPLCPGKGLFWQGVGLALFIFLFPVLHGLLPFLIFIYSVIIFSMVWRAMARVDLNDSERAWTKICGFLGSLSFAASDFMIGVNRFHTTLPHAYYLIMVTYYAGQLGIALSVVDSQTDVSKKKEK